MGNFGGKVHHETINKKQPILLDFLGEILVNRSILHQYDQCCLTFFFNRDNHLLFQPQFTREMSEC